MIQIKCKYSEMVPLSELKPNPLNSNEHSQEQIEHIADVIEADAVRHPIIVSKQTGYIAAGEGRWLAAQKLHMEKFPVDYQDFDNEDQELAFLTADNALAKQSFLNMKKVRLEIKARPGLKIRSLGIAGLGIVKEHTRIEKKETRPKSKIKCPECGAEF